MAGSDQTRIPTTAFSPLLKRPPRLSPQLGSGRGLPW